MNIDDLIDDKEQLQKVVAKIKKDMAKLPAKYKKGKSLRSSDEGEEETEGFTLGYDPESEEYVIEGDTGYSNANKDLTRLIKETFDEIKEGADDFCNDLGCNPDSLSFGYDPIKCDTNELIDSPEATSGTKGDALLICTFEVTYTAEYEEDEDDEEW